MDPISSERDEGRDLPVEQIEDHAIPTTKQDSVETTSPSHQEPGVNSDDDEEQEGVTRLDPAWGIKRTDSAHILDGVHRSSSFPAMSPSVAEFPPISTRPVPDAEGDELPLGVEEPIPIANEVTIDPQPHQPLLPASAVPQEQHSDRPPEDAEGQRYDEGVPLIPQSQEPLQTPANPVPDFDTVDEDASFFAQIDGGATAKKQPPFLDRKDTADVIDKMNFGDAGSDSPLQRPVGDANQVVMAKADPEDPWAAALDDDDEFLVEDADDLLSDSEPGSPDAFAAALREEDPQLPLSPSRPGFPHRMSNSYAPHQPSTSELTQFAGAMHQTSGLPRPPAAFQAQQQQSNIVNRAESFVDQSKGGYKSPYDLPMDLAPKRKPQIQRTQQPAMVVPPPPRTSSMTADKQLQSPFTPTAPAFSQKTPMSPPMAKVSSPPSARTVGPSAAPVPNPDGPRKPASGFFEELPITSRPRPSAAPIRAPPQQMPAIPPTRPTASIIQPPPAPSPQVQQTPQGQANDLYAQYELRPPEKLDPYANVPLLQSNTASAVAPVSNRYSPAPPVVQNGIRPSPSPRYSPAPPSQAPNTHNRYASQPISAQAPLPFQPRTSSPLAQHRRSVDEQGPAATLPLRAVSHHSASSSLPAAASLPPPQAAVGGLSPPGRVDPVKQPGFAPPRRSQTQSPSQQVQTLPPAARPPPTNRPASAFGQMTPSRTIPQSMIASPPAFTQIRAVPEELDLIPPADDSQLDPLQRWKGAPIFRFGFGGGVVQSIPVRTPRYSAGSSKPQFRASPGVVKQLRFSEIAPLPLHVSSFPGPLKGKSKKKEVLNWISTHINSLEARQATLTSPIQPLDDERKRDDERLLLWKLIKILIEHDGTLESTQSLQAVNAVLMPEIHALDEATATQYRDNEPLQGIYRPAGAALRNDTVDPLVVEVLRKHLLKGKRDDAVWHAVDNRLWSHAFLLASTLDRSVWKQVVQEFVKQEVKPVGTNSESLCAIYEIFGGNMDESVDQLVPPSARAGLRMVSKVDSTGPSKNAFDGLDRWKETLSLVLNNRTPEDQRALVTLARLLADYGRIEAAHICLLLARSATHPVAFGGVDDPHASIVLLGADHRHRPADFHHDVDAVLLTELYDFAMSNLASSSATTMMPHLAAFKLQRAYELAEAGMKSEAQAYCDHIAAGLGKSTKQSLYYQSLLLGEIEDLSNRLKQTPMQSTSWMAKPSIEKVSGSVWNKFSSFVTGEDSDAESKGSVREAAEAAPFANVSGSPGPSRSESQADIYSSYAAAAPAATAAGSRYAPNGMGSSRSSSELTRGRASFEAQRSPPSMPSENSAFNVYAPNTHGNMYSHGASPSMSMYSPNPETHMASVAEEPAMYGGPAQPYTPDVPQEHTFNPVQPAFGGYSAPQQTDDSSRPGSEPIVNDAPPPHPVLEQSYGGYQPPEDVGYVPYQPEAESSDEDTQKKPKPKKTSSMGDDDDYTRFSANSSGPQNLAPPSSSGSDNVDVKAKRAANDAAADAAFRAAAEADAQRAADAKNKSKRQSGGGWLGGWFAGKKPDSLDGGKAGPTDSKKPVQVHLGESKMKLYYDKEKGKWVNPDNPEASEKKAVAPPPRSNAGTPAGASTFGGPPRSVPSPIIGGPPSRTATPAGVESEPGSVSSRPGSSSAAGATGIGATLPPSTNQSLGISGATPPSRPSSALSSASGLDDLLGGPPTGGRKVSGRGAGRGKKPGRYVDIMAK